MSNSRNFNLKNNFLSKFVSIITPLISLFKLSFSLKNELKMAQKDAKDY
jgi:hypothetical protein